MNTQHAVSLQDVLDAQKRISPFIPVTPLTHSPALSELAGHAVYIKWDNKLKTGSFKERGALNFLLCLDEGKRSQGVCAASAGNHALALSYHAKRFNAPCTIVMPTNAPLVKVQSTQANGATIIFHGTTFDEAYSHALELSGKQNLTFVPGFDHPAIVAGQGVSGLEILQQLPELDSLIVPCGGGGLLSGCALVMKMQKPTVFVLGAQSDWIVDTRKGIAQTIGKLSIPSIADGIAVKKIGALNQKLLDQYVDTLVPFSEQEIAKAITGLLEMERSVVEGAGAVGVAALSRKVLPPHCRATVVVISGSNIDVNLLTRLIHRDLGERGRILRLMVSVPDRPGSLHSVSGMIATLGANVLEVVHDRAFSRLPGTVDIMFILEVRDFNHQDTILNSLRETGIPCRQI